MNSFSDIAAEVAGYTDVAKKIIDLAVFGAAQNRSHRRLADFTDTIGNRVSGSHNLELAIKYMYNAMSQDGLDVHLGEYALSSVSLGRRMGGVCNEDNVTQIKGSFTAMSLVSVTVVFLSPFTLFLLQSQSKSLTGSEGRRVQK